MILRQAYFGPKLGGVYLTTHATAYGWQAYVGGRKRQWGWEGFGKHKSREQCPPRPCWEGNGRRGDAIGGGGSGRENGQELIWVNIFREELISVNIGGAYFSKVFRGGAYFSK